MNIAPLVTGLFIFFVILVFYQKYSVDPDAIHIEVRGVNRSNDYQYRAYQTYYDKTRIPDKIHENWKKFAPEYHRVILDDQEGLAFLRTHFSPNVTERFLRLRLGAHKADLLRYCLLYIHGGLYADIKTVWVRPVAPLFSDPSKMYVVFSRLDNWFDVLEQMFHGSRQKCFNGVFFSPPGNPILLFLIKHILASSNGSIRMDYLHICRFMCSLLEALAGSPLRLGPMRMPCGFPDLVCYEEVEVSEEHCSYRSDRYGLCTFIRDSSGNLIIKVRDSDFPWKRVEGFESKVDIPLVAECRYTGHGFDEAFEVGECSVAVEIIPQVKNVLEIGGGTGKVSHMINSLLKDPTRHVVVEPGSQGLGNHGDEYLRMNRQLFGDKYTIVNKFAEHLTMDDLAVLGGPPDCLFVDCEGCLEVFFATGIGKYVLQNARFIVNEMDGHVRHARLDPNLRKVWTDYGFKLYKKGYGCGEVCITEVWVKK